jgi:NADH-quinone oxidoreductase subunit N
MTFQDWSALSPLLILFFSSLLVLILESINPPLAKKWAYFLTLVSLLVAGAFSLYSGASTNPLLTNWIKFDALMHFFTLFFIGIGVGVVLMSPFFQGEYFFLLLSSLTGLILIGSAADFLTLFLGIEILSIPLYILCGYIKNQTLSHESAIKYFLTGALATAFLVYGIALVYGATGTTQLEGLLSHYQLISTSQDHFLFLAGIAFITLALCFKAAIVPFHQWAPDVYAGSPLSIVALMAVGTKVGAFAALIRIFILALPQFSLEWNASIAWLAAITMIYANFVALKQVRLKRFFAYSGIAQAGFLLIPFASGAILTPLLFYLVIYALATLGCFSVLRTLEHSPQEATLDDLRGLFKHSPFLAFLFSLCLLTLAGIPPTAGFLAKFFILKEAFQAGYLALGLLGLLSSVLSIYYYLRPIAYMLQESKENKPLGYYGVVALIVSFSILAISLFPTPLWNYLGEIR